MSQKRRPPAPISKYQRDRAKLMRQIRQMATGIKDQATLDRAFAGLKPSERSWMTQELKPYLGFTPNPCD